MINHATREKMITSVEDEGEIRTEERKEICAGAMLMATHTYTRNPESPLGKEIDLQQWDTLIFKREHAENEHWRLVEVGYAPAAFLVIIIDTAAEEEESDATKKGQENSTEENQIGGWIGQELKRRKSYSAAGTRPSAPLMSTAQPAYVATRSWHDVLLPNANNNYDETRPPGTAA